MQEVECGDQFETVIQDRLANVTDERIDPGRAAVDADLMEGTGIDTTKARARTPTFWRAAIVVADGWASGEITRRACDEPGDELPGLAGIVRNG